MIVSFFYIILAALGLGFLIFIHELGHYYMARRVGMRVEAFGIGFGKPIYTWVRDGVQWRLCWLPFGGYVKIAGMESEEGRDPYEVADGYFGQKPLDRVKVAFMGPFVNIVFAFLIFALLWVSGGRQKNFSEFTSIIGWVDPHSELYSLGVRPGDLITAYDGSSFQSAKDHLYAPMTAASLLKVSGAKVDHKTNEKTPFEYTVRVYSHPASFDKDLKTAGILNSASYVIYNRLPGGQENPLPEGSPLHDSGIQYGDRVLWVDGEQIYSDQQLSHILNDGRVLLTIERGKEILLRRVPRVFVQELKVDSAFKEELIDWQYEAQLNNTKIQRLYTIPYNITSENVVENEFRFIDIEEQNAAFPKAPFSDLEQPLLEGDKIIAIDGTAVAHAYQFLRELQEHHATIIVERDPNLQQSLSSKEEDANFNKEIRQEDLNEIALSIGTGHPIVQVDNLFLLNRVTPKMRSEFDLSEEAQLQFINDLMEKRKQIDAIEDTEKRAQALHLLEAKEKQLIVGLPAYQDRKVSYNPNPVTLFVSVFDEIRHTLSALVSGYLNPKWISGPIGIVQVVHHSWMVSLKDGLFWVGAISLNLGILNLLPIPVLDGGYICLSLFEKITGIRLKPKTMERLIIPFAILLIGFLVFLTYHDLMRILGIFLG